MVHPLSDKSGVWLSLWICGFSSQRGRLFHLPALIKKLFNIPLEVLPQCHPVTFSFPGKLSRLCSSNLLLRNQGELVLPCPGLLRIPWIFSVLLKDW